MKIVLLASDGTSTNIVYNAVSAHFPIEQVIIEDAVATSKFLKYRYKKLGLLRVVDQLLFILTISKALAVSGKKRIAGILSANGLNANSIPTEKIIRVESANAAATIELIQKLAPDLLLVNGTRILSKKLLAAAKESVIVNLHAGITPEYRGVHGAYWAYVSKQPDLAGVTLHYVDSGVDTGNIIGQAVITKQRQDNFATYPSLQLAAGIKMLLAFIDAKKTNTTVIPVILSKGESSKQWYHPGFFEYLYHRLFNGVK